MALFAQAHAKYTRFYRWSSKRRKRPHGALAGLKALLAARREKQKVKEDASNNDEKEKDEDEKEKDKEEKEKDKEEIEKDKEEKEKDEEEKEKVEEEKEKDDNKKQKVTIDIVNKDSSMTNNEDEDSSTTYNLHKGSSTINNEDRDSSNTGDKNKDSSTTHNKDKGSLDTNDSSSTNNMTAHVEYDDNVKLKDGNPTISVKEDQHKDEKEEEEDRREEEIAEEEDKEEADLTHLPKGVESWEKNESANPAFSEELDKQNEISIPIESERESDKVASEHLPATEKAKENDKRGLLHLICLSRWLQLQRRKLFLLPLSTNIRARPI